MAYNRMTININKMTGADCAVMCNLIKIYTHTHKALRAVTHYLLHRNFRERERVCPLCPTRSKVFLICTGIIDPPPPFGRSNAAVCTVLMNRVE